MGDDARDDQILQTLRDGLRAQPVPATSPDFDARILDALQALQPWWRRWWEPARPLLMGAACSLPATLLLLHWSLSGPAAPTRPRLPVVTAAAPPRLPSLDALLARPNLCAASLAQAWEAPAAPPAASPPKPRRRAEVSPAPTVAA